MANFHRNFDSRQDSDSHGSQISVFKVKIDCCDDCPKKLKAKLLALNGIESVELDERQNLAAVKGIIDSRKIIEKLENRGKTAELVHERRKTNRNGYMVEVIDDDEEEEEERKIEKDSFSDSFRHKDSSFCRKSSSHSRNDSSFSARHRDKGSSHKPEKYERPKSNANSARHFPDHICRDKYCTIHRRDNSVPGTNNDTNYPPLFRGGFNYPMMNSYAPAPTMFGRPLLPPYGEYYGPGMQPLMAGYSGYARQMPRSWADGYPGNFWI